MVEPIRQEERLPPPPKPRSGAIEFLQVCSLAFLVGAWILRQAGVSEWYPTAAIFAALLCFLLSFWLVRVPEKTLLPSSVHGFRVTQQRLRTLEQLGVPPDIREAIGSSIVDRRLTARELREELYSEIGEARVRPWLHMIFLHTKVFEPPEAKGREPELRPAKDRFMAIRVVQVIRQAFVFQAGSDEGR